MPDKIDQNRPNSPSILFSKSLDNHYRYNNNACIVEDALSCNSQFTSRSIGTPSHKRLAMFVHPSLRAAFHNTRWILQFKASPCTTPFIFPCFTNQPNRSTFVTTATGFIQSSSRSVTTAALFHSKNLDSALSGVSSVISTNFRFCGLP